MYFFYSQRDISIKTNPFDLSFEIWLAKDLPDLNQSLPDFLSHWKSWHELMNHEDIVHSLRTQVRISHGVYFFVLCLFLVIFQMIGNFFYILILN